MAGPSEGGGMLEVVGAQRRDVLTAGDVAETSATPWETSRRAPARSTRREAPPQR